MNDTTITMVANLCGDPELKFLPSGAAICKFAVASTPRVYDRDKGAYRDGDPLFLNCTAWRQLAENIAESLTKGARVVVTGRLKQSRWETPDGDKRSAYGLDVEEIGPSLRFATASVHKLTRTPGRGGSADDAWSAAGPNRPATSADSGFGGDEPPF